MTFILSLGMLGCGGGDEGGEPASVDLTPHTYEADDPRISYTGRVDFADPKNPRFSLGGTYIQARFDGTAATVMLRDEIRYGDRNYFDAIIDDGEPFKIAPTADQTSYEVATGLPAGEHTITLAKRTEANIGYAEFLGFTFMGEMLPAPEPPARRMIFIGDSITAGSGNEAANGSEQCSEDGWGQPYHNAHLSYAAVAARALEAEYHVVGVSGIGLVRNYSSMYDARPMPEVYDLLHVQLTNSPAWDPAAFVPDAVVVALGTNDFSPGDSEREKMSVDTFTETYIAFVEKLRGYYPDAHVFAISSPMLGDGWPDSTYTSATDQKTAIAAVAEHFAGAGDANVHSFDVTKLSGTGCGTHPSASQHAALGAELEEHVRGVMGW